MNYSFLVTDTVTSQKNPSKVGCMYTQIYVCISEVFITHPQHTFYNGRMPQLIRPQADKT